MVLLLIHLISLSSLLWPLLTLKHPEEALGADPSHWIIHILALFLTSGGAQSHTENPKWEN